MTVTATWSASSSLVVPYIAQWTGESAGRMRITYRQRGDGIAYVDERPSDRDRHGVLWSRITSHQGRGQPRSARSMPGGSGGP